MPENGNGNGAAMAEDSGEYRQRVRGLERQQDVFSSQIANLSTRMDGQYSALSAKIDEKFGTIQQGQRPQWNNIIAACSFTFALLSGLVTLITVPIFYQIGDIKGTITGEIKTSIKETRTEMAEAIVRGRSDRDVMMRDMRAEINGHLKDIREQIVPREEHKERWAGQARHDDDTQRQLNQLYENQQGIYNARDVIQQLLRDVGDLKRPGGMAKN